MKRMIPSLFGCVLVGLSATAFADDSGAEPVSMESNPSTVTAKVLKSDSPERPQMNINVPEYSLNSKDFNFPSGLRVIMQADRSQPVVGVTSYVDRGSSDDPEGKEGIAHFVEHLWFRSEHGDLPKVWNILDDLGCMLNASTGSDWTNYMTVAPSSALPHLIKLEALRLTHPVRGVTQAMVDVERDVIRNELRMRKENGFMGAIEYIYPHLFPSGHAYGRSGIGSHESLDNIQLEDIQKFTVEHYKPELTTIVIVGDFDPERASDLLFENLDPAVIHPKMTEEDVQRFVRADVEGEPDLDNPDHFQLWPIDPDTKEAMALGAPPIRVDRNEALKPPPPVADPGPATYDAPVEHPMVVVAWSVPGAYRGNDVIGNLAANTVGGYMSFFLRENRKELGIRSQGGSYAGCGYWNFEVDSMVFCLAELKSSSNAVNVGEKMLDQIVGVWSSRMDIVGMDAAAAAGYLEQQRRQLQQAKMSNLAGTLESIDTIAALSGRATQIAEHAHYTGSHTYHSDQMREVMGIDDEKVIDFAFEHLTRDRAAIVVLKPIPEEDIVLDSSESEYHAAQSTDDVLNSTVDPAIITPELVKSTIELPAIDKILEKTLDNGLRVVILDHGDSPIVTARLIYGGGTVTGEEPGLQEYFSQNFSTSAQSDYNDQQVDPLQIAGRWGGASMDTHSAEDVTFSSGNVDGGLWLLRQTIERLKPDLAGKPMWLKDRFDYLQDDWGTQSWWLSKAQWETLNPGHPTRATRSWEELELMKDWGSSEVQDYLDSKYQPKNATLLVVGELDAVGGSEKALELVSKYFAGWQAKPGAGAPPVTEVPGPNQPGAPRIIVLDDAKNTQTDITYICPISADYADNKSAQSVLGEVASERLWGILREQAGVTYGAGAGTFQSPGGSSFMYMSSLVQNGAAPFAIKTFQGVIEDLSAGGAAEEKVKQIKYNVAKKKVLGQQSVGQILGRLTSAVALDDEDWSRFEREADNLANVTVEDITKALGQCKDHAVITVQGPEGYVDHALEKDGIEFEMFEWKEEGEELLKKYDLKAYEKGEKSKAKDAKKDAKKMAKLITETNEWVGQEAPSGYGEEPTIWYQGEHTYDPEKLTASIYFQYNSSSARENTPEVVEALAAYEGDLDVVWLHSTSGTAIEQKVLRFAQDYGIEAPIAGYGEIEDLSVSAEEEEEAQASKDKSDPMDERLMSAVHSKMIVAEDYDSLAPEEYAARPLVVLTKGGKYIGIYNPKALTKEFLDSLQ
jgi:zinc protease